MAGLSDEARLAFAPGATYASLTASRGHASWSRAIAGPLFGALLLGTALSIAGTHVASLPAVLGVGLFWSFAPAFQLLTAWTICRRAPRPRVTLPRAIELLFLAHLPYSLWLVAFAMSSFVLAPGPALVNGLLLTAIVPIVWTPLLSSAFSREVLGCSPREARRLTILHQALTWALILALAILAYQPWTRVGGGA